MHWKKIIAPVIITAILILLFGVYLYSYMLIPMSLLLKAVVCLIFVGLIGVSIYNLISRIIEIRSGEEDDLSKY